MFTHNKIKKKIQIFTWIFVHCVRQRVNFTSCSWCVAPSAVHKVPLPFTLHKLTVQYMACLQLAKTEN